MRERKLFCIGLLPILLCSLALLALTLAFKWRHIEGELKDSTVSTLAGDEYAWAKVETYNLGRDVLLTGSPPDQANLDSALKLAEDTYGVRSASHNGDAFSAVTEAVVEAEPAPAALPLSLPELRANLNGDRLLLSGTLSSQAEVDQVYAQALESYEGINVINELRVGDNIDSIGNSGFINALKEGAQSMHLSGGVLRLIGNVASSELKSQAEASARQSFAGTISNELVVVETIKRDVCQDSINGLLATASINFDTGKSSISADSTELLDSIASTAKRCPDASFEIGGHTDSTGNLDSNMALSQRRAQAVADYLIAQGLTNDRFVARGYGPQSPIADNSTSQGRAQNRRIEFKLSN